MRFGKSCHLQTGARLPPVTHQHCHHKMSAHYWPDLGLTNSVGSEIVFGPYSLETIHPRTNHLWRCRNTACCLLGSPYYVLLIFTFSGQVIRLRCDQSIINHWFDLLLSFMDLILSSIGGAVELISLLSFFLHRRRNLPRRHVDDSVWDLAPEFLQSTNQPISQLVNRSIGQSANRPFGQSAARAGEIGFSQSFF